MSQVNKKYDFDQALAILQPFPGLLHMPCR